MDRRTKCNAKLITTAILLGLVPSLQPFTCTAACTGGRRELLDNPGLEPDYRAYSINEGRISGRIAYAWYDNTEWAGPWAQLVYSEDRAVVAQGSSSQRVDVPYRPETDGKDGAAFVQFAAVVYLRPGRYSASVRLRALSSAPGGRPLRARLQLRRTLAPYDDYGSSGEEGVALRDSAWTQLVVQPAVVPTDSSNPDAPVNIMLVVNGQGTGTLWIDDASICALDTGGAGVVPSSSASPPTPAPSPPPRPPPPALSLPAVRPVCGARAVQLLRNPGFESGFWETSTNGGRISGRVPDEWDDNTEWAGPWVLLRYSQDTGAVAQGGSSLRVDIPWRAEAAGQEGAEYMQFGQVLQLGSGRYSASMLARAEPNPQAGGPMLVRLLLRGWGAPYAEYGSSPQVELAAAGSWTQLAVDAARVPAPNMPSSATADVALMVYTHGAGTLWLDDAHLCAAEGSDSGGGSAPQPSPPAHGAAPATPPAQGAAGGGGAACGRESPELLQNPGFEEGWAPVNQLNGNISGQVASWWYDNTEWAGPWTALRYSQDREVVAQGGSSQRIELPHRAQADVRQGAEFMQFVQQLSLAPGRYSASIKLRATTSSNGGAGSGSMLVSLGLRLREPPQLQYGSVLVAPGDGGWTQAVVNGVLIPGDPASGERLNILLVVWASGAGTLWLDDAHLCASGAEYRGELDPPKDTPVPPQYFCLNANFMFEQPGYPWPSLRNFAFFRTWDSGIIWATIQPDGPSQFNWDQMDHVAAQARAHGQRVMFTLGQSPAWASSIPGAPSLYGPGRGAPPSRLGDWSAFVEAVARRYGELIFAYEVWNEPDIPAGPDGFYSGTPQDMVALERATREALRAAGSSALLLSPPLSSGAFLVSLRWMEDYLAAGGGRLCDAIGLHMYDQPPDGVGAQASVANVRALISAHGLVDSSGAPLRIWNTEGGLDLWALGAASEAPGVRTAAGVVARQALFGWAMGMQCYCPYAYGSDRFTGLSVWGDPLRLAEPGLAFDTVAGWMTGVRMTTYECNLAGVCSAQLVRPGGSPAARVVWSTTGPTQFALPAAWGTFRSATDLAGVRTTLPRARRKRGLRISLTDKPQLLEP